MIRQLQKLWPLSILLGLFLTPVSFPCASAANVMNYGADGNDYYQFTTPSMAFDKASGFTTLITFAMHVNPDGTLLIGGNVACTNGMYTGPANWGSLIATLKTPPTTVTRYEVCIGGYEDTSYNNLESLAASQGTGPGSMLYKNFQALKYAVPGIDAINDDDEETYDLNSSTAFANMLGGLGYKFTMVPYTAQSFWVNLYNNITNCDNIYLQCYEGGAGNDPGQWDSAFGHGVVVTPGQESNTANPATFHNWHLETGVQGGFYYPDVVFDSTYWSAAIIEANGAVPPAPTGVSITQGGREASLSWNTVPGAISYNVKCSTSSDGETTIGTISTVNNNWPESNHYTDLGLSSGTNYYYEVSAVNTNGESLNSAEISATLPAGTVNNPSFEFDVVSGPGQNLNSVPSGWTAFNENNGDIGSQWAGGIDYTVFDPLAPPASGNQYCFVNLLSQSLRGGIYQDVGPMQPNTIYTLTVAIGSRNDRINSPGIISLVRGLDNTGKVMATGGGIPATQNSWQDYTVTFTNGTSTQDLCVMLSADGNSTTIQSDFDNVRLTSTPFSGTPPPPVLGNPSFEEGTGAVPAYWTEFNDNDFSIVTEANPGEYTATDPLAPPANGTNFFAINEGPGDPATGGIYQEYAPLQPNTIYTLAVAMGKRADNGPVPGQWSPGIISLINGDNNNGTVLASTNGLSNVAGAWQDFTVTYTTGASVSGDLSVELSVAPAATYQANFDNVVLTVTPLMAPKLGAPRVSAYNLILAGTGGTPNAGYIWLVTTNLAPPVNWQTNSSGSLDGTGSVSNSFPINPASPASFFQLRLP
jgi:hypothetical protein